jgi:hypothetical protein
MKKVNLLLCLAAVLFAISSCKKCKPAACNLIPAKVIRYDCDRVIFQLLRNEAIGDADWVDVQTGLHYSNVVSYYDNCAISTITKNNIATIYVDVKKISDNLNNPNCYQCLAVSSNPPVTKVNFLSISKEPCGDDIK